MEHRERELCITKTTGAHSWSTQGFVNSNATVKSNLSSLILPLPGSETTKRGERVKVEERNVGLMKQMTRRRTNVTPFEFARITYTNRESQTTFQLLKTIYFTHLFFRLSFFHFNSFPSPPLFFKIVHEKEFFIQNSDKFS